ncbi:uncharacterized protein LOC130724891 [Lotus japonicus]|uniref:uncharacterized protein LOC130724891 n=1 Tax=Lotus japonicus TaxID=34305 RepID=UPI002584D51C|nr:uncharacterized protein LOC130724891 [Lotus japonicus]
MTLKDTSTFTVFRTFVVVASWTPPQLAVAARRRLRVLFEVAGSRSKWIAEGDQNTGFFHASINWKRRANSIVGLLVDGVWEENLELIKKADVFFFETKFKSDNWDRLVLDGVQFRVLSEADNAMLDDFVRNVLELWSKGAWPKGSNASFIVLIPKVSSPQSLGEFRPISLIGCMYKVVSKLLAGRLKLVLGKVIDVRQFAFLGGRNMLDSVVVANEVVHEAKVRKKPTIIFKVDYEKAYDSVRWDFLFYMMRRMNFECWLMAAHAVNLKWRRVEWLASFLFLIVAEGLNGLFMNAVKLGKFNGFKVGEKDSVEVSLLQFAYDTIFIGEASLRNTVVNFHKSKLAAVSLGTSELYHFASILHCKMMKVPFIYLGIPVGGCTRRHKTWEPVIQKMPSGVVNTCNSIMREFLWGGGGEVRKIAWVSWTSICKPKEVGGLGIKDLSIFNKSLLGKWRWRYLNEPDSFWCRVIKAKYFGNNAMQESLWWRDVMASSCDEDGDWLDLGAQKTVKGGNKTKFWLDDWVGNGRSLVLELEVEEATGGKGAAVAYWDAPVLLPPDPVYNRVWKALTPSNVKAFSWRLLLDIIPSLMNLWKRKVLLSSEEAICKEMVDPAVRGVMVAQPAGGGGGDGSFSS